MFGVQDDDDDFMASGSSKLASLFGIEPSSSHDGNQSLMYNAPKQPKKAKPTSEVQAQPPASSAMAVVHAVGVHTYKYEGGKHVSQGKLGAAILGNHVSGDYKLILYKGKQQHVGFATISINFSFIVQANNYATFYDDQRQNWSVNFDSEQAISEFAKQVCLAKVNSCCKPLDSVVVQDLTPGEGEGLDAGDSAEIRYTGWILSDHKLGEMFDSNTSAEKSLRVKLGQGKCIKGMEDALVGIKKLSKRCAVVPPLLGYANREIDVAVLKTSTLVYEIEVKKVKFTKDGSGTRSSTPSVSEGTDEKKGEQVRQHSSSFSEDASIRARGASLSEQLSQSPNRKKATIISRMVKMGIGLPLHGAVVANASSESENEDEIIAIVDPPPVVASPAPEVTSPKPVAKPRPQHVAATSSVPQTHQHPATSVSVHQPVAIYQPSMYGMPGQSQYSGMPPGPQYGMFPSAQYAPQPVASPVMVGAGDSHLPLLLSESRSQSMEIRLQLGKLTEKLDQIWSKVDQSPSSNSAMVSSMDTATLSYNIQRIFQENERLRTELVEKNKRIDTQNEKICELLQKNQHFIEQSTNMMEQRSNSMQVNAVHSQALLLSLEQEKMRLSTELSDVTTKENSLHLDLKHSQQEVHDLNNLNETLKKKVSTLQADVDRCQQKLQALEDVKGEMEQVVEKESNARIELERHVKRLQESQPATSSEPVENRKIIEMKREHEDKIANLSREMDSLRALAASSATTGTSNNYDMVAELKKVMNLLFKRLQAEFDTGENYSGTDVRQQLIHTIREVTLILMDTYSSTDDNEQIEDDDVDAKTLVKTKEILPTDNSSENKLPTSEQESKGNPDPVTADVSSTSNEVVEDHEKDDSVESQTLPQKPIEAWKPQPPPPPVFGTEEDDDDCLN